jgi:cytochrome b subunit of formate dehydrogenase
VAGGGEPMTDYVVRFSPRQRAEHLLMLIVFTVLCVTGLPQKYFQSDISIAIVNALGGLGPVRWMHRAAGVIFVLMTVAHLAIVMIGTMTGRMKLSMAVTRQDFRDAIKTLRYYLGMSNEQAHFGRFDYKQKFEYWGLIMGGLVVCATGLMLLYPIEVASLLPAQLIPVAKAAHSNEGLLAFLTIVTWHVYSVIFAPEVFPLDTTIFTGKISMERMHHEHPLELEEMQREGVLGVPKVSEVPKARTTPAA